MTFETENGTKVEESKNVDQAKKDVKKRGSLIMEDLSVLD
jgi:hypothetical protein